MSWERVVLDCFPKSLEQLILVADPDSVIKNERISKELIGKGFIILDYTDSISFRFLFENNYREGNESNKLIVRLENSDFKLYPYDLLQMGYKVDLQLENFFPKLSYPILKHIDPETLHLLYSAYERYDGSNLGESGTASFILQNVYGIAPKLINNREELFKILLYLHYKKIDLPEPLVDNILSDLELRDSIFDNENFNIKKCILRKDYFYGFLQQQWNLFIKDLEEGSKKALIPFDHDDIKVYIDSYFIEGILQPVSLEKEINSLPMWTRLGIKGYEEMNKKKKFSKLIETLENFLFQKDTDYRDWLHSSYLLSEAVVLFNDIKDVVSEKEMKKYLKIHNQLENDFAKWLIDSFGSLVSLSFIKAPVMVHHIPKHISYWRKKGELDKVALIVIDGLALNQWIIVKDFLVSQIEGLNIDEKTTFAWVPTMTSISRQSIFAGEVPIYFKDSIYSNYREEQLWKRFWQNEGLKSFQIKYKKGLGRDDLEEVKDLIGDSKTQILGLVIDTVDKMTHGQYLGIEGILQDIELWLKEGYLVNLVRELFNSGYCVYLASDHGSVDVKGQGMPNQGVLVETKGERTRIYEDETFLKEVMDQYDSIKWPGHGLPENLHVLIAETGSAYVTEGEKILSHGGISIEEVIVPFVRLWEE